MGERDRVRLLLLYLEAWFSFCPLNRIAMTIFMQSVYLLLFVFCPVAMVMFMVRLIVALVSPKVPEEMRKHPTIHMVWGGVAFVGALVILGAFSPLTWPPRFIERQEQRQRFMERVQAAGGWDAIRRGCASLAEQNTNGFYGSFRDTNRLPAAIATLKPMIVEYHPQFGCVRMRIFGIHSTGGHSTPYFGLEVDTSTNSMSYNHGARYDNGGVIGNHHSVANQVAEGIYELY
jgi:hypothetical protein